MTYFSATTSVRTDNAIQWSQGSRCAGPLSDYVNLYTALHSAKEDHRSFHLLRVHKHPSYLPNVCSAVSEFQWQHHHDFVTTRQILIRVQAVG